MMTNYDFAVAVLGQDFISPEEIMKFRKGIIYTDEQLAQFGKTFPTQEIILWCRDNDYILVAGPNRPMSLLEIRDMKNDYFYSKEGGWYADVDQKFSQKEKVETRWYMIRKNPVPESTHKNWKEQQSLISDVETVPNLAEFIWAITTYKAVRNTYLFRDGIYVRTSSLCLNGNHAYVSYSGDEGLGIDNYWDGNRHSNLSLSVARK